MIYTPLMEHQKKILNFIVKKPYFGIFADYGTGKTLCALSYIEFYKKKLKKILVVSTKTSIESTWAYEIEKHTDFRYIMLLGTKKRKLELLELGLKMCQPPVNDYYSSGTVINPVLFLINFDGLKNIYEELMLVNFDLLIVDESTKIKNIKSKRTRILLNLAKYVKRRCIMTGFPVTENLIEIYSQIKFLDFGERLGRSFYEFLNKYFVKTGFKFLPKRSAVKEIPEKIKDCCIRISNVDLKLPPKIYKNIYVNMTETQKTLISQLNELFKIEFKKIEYRTEYIFALINKSLEIFDGFLIDDKGNVEYFDTEKDEALIDIIEEIDPFKYKIVIWTVFKNSVNRISKILDKMRIKHLCLTGEVKDAGVIVDKFQNDKDYRALIAIQKKASESITLTSCCHAIYYSTSWSFDERSNSEHRIYRKGSEKHESVFYIDIIVKNTIDEKLRECLMKKKDFVSILKEHFSKIEEIGYDTVV